MTPRTARPAALPAARPAALPAARPAALPGALLTVLPAAHTVTTLADLLLGFLPARQQDRRCLVAHWRPSPAS